MLTLKPKDAEYPQKLHALHDPPRQLFVQSDSWVALNALPKVSVVGTRRPSHYGAHVCTKIVQELASRGVCIVSGLALGMDSIAHKAALDVGGATIAVLPSGFDHIAPASHRQLAQDIMSSGGALVSEYPPHTRVSHKAVFIARNRIIAALADALLIPEASAKSGSLHTARFALDIGIEVLAIPGHITNPLAEGCHSLIQSGAMLATSAQDIFNVLQMPSFDHGSRSATINGSTPQETILLQAIANGQHDGDELIASCGLSIESFNQTITMLEITGRIRAGGGNTWYLV